MQPTIEAMNIGVRDTIKEEKTQCESDTEEASQAQGE